MAQDYFHENGIYLMDEPEAALSPQRQLSLLIHIAKLAEAGAQFVIATHSPILLGIPDAHIYSFEADGVSDSAYEDTDSYRITKLFVENRERMLEKLLEED
ncbi:MAG: AAA family ATPase [Solobacterium sp.]|nr:AAA family ATPase [Solobacterium sp.]